MVCTRFVSFNCFGRFEKPYASRASCRYLPYCGTKNLNENMIKELTCGSFGRFLWFHWCFNIQLDDQQLIIAVPFHRKVIPVNKIEKMESVKSFMQPKHLKLLYRGSAQNIQAIQFFSIDPSMWFYEFDRLGVRTEDLEGLRNRKNDTSLRFAKILNISVGAFAAVVAIMALVIAVFAIVKKIF